MHISKYPARKINNSIFKFNTNYKSYEVDFNNSNTIL